MYIEYREPKDFELTQSIRAFLKDHNIELQDTDGMLTIGLSFLYMYQIIKATGYNIEVSEVSAANKNFGTIKGKDWHRLNKYRWSIVYFDEYGTMISLTYSDDGQNHNFFDNEEDAYRDAINYIIDNYKTLEE